MRRRAILGVLLACASPLRAQEPPPNGESWALFQGLAAVRRIDVTVPAGPCEVAARRLAAGLRASARFEVSLDPAARDPEALRVLAGTVADPGFAALAARLGLAPATQGFHLLGREFAAPGDAIVAVLEDPARAGRPLVLALGNDPDLLAVYLDGLPRPTRPHLWVYAAGELALECPLAPGGAPRAELAVDYRARRADYFAGQRRQEFEGVVVNVRGEVDGERWKRYGLALAGARKRTLEWLGTPDENVPVVELFLYEHHEDFERCLGTSALNVVNRLQPRVHVLLAPGVPDDGGAGLARALARALAGPAAGTWLEDGLAVAAAGSWWGRPLDVWLAHLARARLLPGADGLFTAQGEARLSEHALVPARALLVQELVRSAGGEPRKVRALWKGAGADPRAISTVYRRAIDASMRSAGARRAAGRAETGDETPFRHGLALLASERAGYGSRRVEEALDEAGELAQGPDAVSLTVFSAGEDPCAPLLDPHPAPVHASSSDAALASAVAAARARGLATLLSLEVLSHPYGAWADVISWTASDDDARFFERYGRIALHHALLAELLGVELFSFGSNLRESTRTEGDEETRTPERLALLERRQRSWQALIARLHGAYLGDLTYAARLPGEAQDVGFFEGLDFLGLVFYPPLAREPGTPEPALLRRALRFELGQAFDLAVRWNRPLLLVQTGFPARADSWQRPQTPRGALDPGAQQAFLEALADELAARRENSAVLRGFFLWNWPLEGARAAPEASAFSLRGGSSAAALGRLFAR